MTVWDKIFLKILTTLSEWGKAFPRSFMYKYFIFPSGYYDHTEIWTGDQGSNMFQATLKLSLSIMMNI